MSDRPNNQLDTPDALSSAITRLELQAEIYVNGDFCGTWAVDTSGSKRIPFHLIASGNAWLHLEGAPPRQLKRGELVIFPGDKQHLMSSDAEIPEGLEINAPDMEATENPTQMICGFFEFQNKSALPLLNSLASVIVLNLGDSSEELQAQRLVEQIIYELKHAAPGHYVVVNQLSYLLFIEIIRQQIRTEQVHTGILAALFDDRLSKALTAIHNHPEKSWSLETLAAEATMGRSSFSAHFTKLTGVSAMQYMTSWRMQYAKVLLQTTRDPMWKIARECGYDSEAAFQKAFKKVIGSPPGKVRRQSRDAT